MACVAAIQSVPPGAVVDVMLPGADAKAFVRALEAEDAPAGAPL